MDLGIKDLEDDGLITIKTGQYRGNSMQIIVLRGE
jgi:hypothetical protein